MKEFLKKYLSEDQLGEIEKKYLANHQNEKGLPMHISKARLDEVLGKKKIAEDMLKELQDSSTADIQKAVKEAQDAAEKDKANMQKDFDITEAIYKAHGRNVKAIKALIDPSKKPSEEIEKLQKSDKYLFEDDIPGGTGKNTPGSDGAGGADKELAAMRAAVGV